MNCLGKGNYAHFVTLLMSLSFLLTYGAYLAYIALTELLQDSAVSSPQATTARKHWSVNKTWSQYFNSWSWAIAQDFRIGGIGLLALLTAPLAWFMFLFHVYLIWTGTTTNESSKWSDWRDWIADGIVYKWVGEFINHNNDHRDLIIEPVVEWPVSSNQELFKSEDGLLPLTPYHGGGSTSNKSTRIIQSETSNWKPVYNLHEINNLYDLGFWDNFFDIFDTR
ncbi:MAG: hypothetical protein Q9190_004723 [Brigantiaea leucoxantha]